MGALSGSRNPWERCPRSVSDGNKRVPGTLDGQEKRAADICKGCRCLESSLQV